MAQKRTTTGGKQGRKPRRNTATSADTAEIGGAETPDDPQKGEIGGLLRKVKVWQLSAYYALLQEMGLDRVVAQGFNEAKESMTIVTAQEQAQPEQVDVQSLTAAMLEQLDMGQMLTTLYGEGGWYQLCRIVFGMKDATEEELDDLDMLEFNVNFYNFVAVWMQPMGLLLGTRPALLAGTPTNGEAERVAPGGDGEE